MDGIRTMFSEYQRELGVDLCFQGFAEELAGLPGKYAPPSGGILVAEQEGEIAACAALRDIGDGIAEIKRLYVRPAYRRRGLARTMTRQLLDRAEEIGYRRVRLDTLLRLPGPVDLYAGMGFREIPAYGFNPEPDIVYMELALGPT
jgi:GNAT superfamily N-acetyltransferase